MHGTLIDSVFGGYGSATTNTLDQYWDFEGKAMAHLTITYASDMQICSAKITLLAEETGAPQEGLRLIDFPSRWWRKTESSQETLVLLGDVSEALVTRMGKMLDALMI